MNTLNDRFLSELFEQKKVKCHQDVYVKLYALIWPCEGYFKCFLSCSETDLKYDYAKKIYRYIRAFEDVILPEYTINNIISLQINKLATTNKGYISQDHVIHSINLYIMGIYLFFNFPLFHNKILLKNFDQKTLYSRTKSFIKKWKLFSLYHDMGNFFESNIDCYGSVEGKDLLILKEYKNIYSHLLYEYGTRSVARTILTAVIIQRSQRTFSSEMINTARCKLWKNKEARNCSNADLKTETLERYKDAIIVDDIQSDIAFSHFVYVLEQRTVLMVIYDRDDYPIGFVERFGNRIKHIYVAIDSILDNSNIYGASNCEELIEQMPIECSLKYCIHGGADAAYAHLGTADAELAKKYYKELPERLRQKAILATTDSQINQCYFSIYHWLIDKAGKYLCADTQIPELCIYEQSMEKYYKEAIGNLLSSHIDSTVNAIHVKNDNIENTLEEIVKKMEINKASISIAIHKEAVQRYSAEEGVSHNMLTYYSQTYQTLLRDFGISGDKQTPINNIIANQIATLQFIEITRKNKIELEIFRHGNQPFEVALYKNIEQLANNLHINFNDLITYSASHSNSDHGLISAGLLFQATVFTHYLTEYSKSHEHIKLAWHGLSGYKGLLTEECVNDYAEVIFAILLHNVYTRKSAPKYGIDYQHSISDDTFSYFCAFCDTFQRWHRPKQLDFSKSGLPPQHFLSDDFDLYIEDNKICLKCNMQDANFIRNSLNEQNDFLPGSIEFVHITEY